MSEPPPPPRLSASGGFGTVANSHPEGSEGARASSGSTQGGGEASRWQRRGDSQSPSSMIEGGQSLLALAGALTQVGQGDDSYHWAGMHTGGAAAQVAAVLAAGRREACTSLSEAIPHFSKHSALICECSRCRPPNAVVSSNLACPVSASGRWPLDARQSPKRPLVCNSSRTGSSPSRMGPFASRWLR